MKSYIMNEGSDLRYMTGYLAKLLSQSFTFLKITSPFLGKKAEVMLYQSSFYEMAEYLFKFQCTSLSNAVGEFLVLL